MSIDCCCIDGVKGQIRLIVFDLDGTLLNDNKSIPQDNISVINALQKEGIEFVIASGRHAKEVFDMLEHNGVTAVKYVICRDGQHVYDNHRKRIRSFPYLSTKDIAHMFSMSNCSNIFCSNEEKDYLIFRTVFKKLKYDIVHFKELKASFLYTQSLIGARISHLRVGKAIFFNQRDIDLEKMKMRFTVHALANGGYDVFPLGVDKFHALEWVAEIMGIKLDEVLYFGDDDNDRECFINLSHVVVMGNAPEELKQYSMLSGVPSNNDSGVSKALKVVFDI